MTLTQRHVAVLVTAPDIDVAQRLARGALEARLAACAQILPGLESHYWWKGELESSAEILVVFKTTNDRLDALEELVRRLHPYETPQFVVLTVSGGSKAYLDWIDAEVGEKK
jgi:periplasmic divalent cation tolerance protein